MKDLCLENFKQKKDDYILSNKHIRLLDNIFRQYHQLNGIFKHLMALLKMILLIKNIYKKRKKSKIITIKEIFQIIHNIRLIFGAIQRIIIMVLAIPILKAMLRR